VKKPGVRSQGIGSQELETSRKKNKSRFSQFSPSGLFLCIEVSIALNPPAGEEREPSGPLTPRMRGSRGPESGAIETQLQATFTIGFNLKLT